MISSKEHATRMGMYGPMTRETKTWQPARLLCKRFGVKDPDPMPAFEFDKDGQATARDAPGSGSAEASGTGRQEIQEELLKEGYAVLYCSLSSTLVFQEGYLECRTWRG
jgi:hypothetical protein